MGYHLLSEIKLSSESLHSTYLQLDY